jgi:hypothetical protein
MVSGGVMTKATGRTSTYGTPHDVEVSHLKVHKQITTTCLPGHCPEDQVRQSDESNYQKDC